MSSLPVPLSPVISTGALVLAMRSTVSSTSRSAADLPMMDGSLPASPGRGVALFSLLLTPPLLGEVGRGLSAVSTRCISVVLFQGLVMKSNAPARIPRTARSMLPHAVMRMTGVSGQNNLTCLSRVSPSSPSVDSEKFMSISMSCGASLRTISIARSGPSAFFVS